MYTQSNIPQQETQRSDSVSDVSQQSSSGDLLVNNLVYSQPKALSLAINRTYNRQWFQRDQYNNGSTAIIDWNTGSDYVKACNSYLTFKVATTGAGSTANFGSGSAMNLIREIKVRSRSGTELDRVERANLWSKIDSRYNMPEAYLKKFGEVQGYGATRVGATDPANVVETTGTRFCIPLKALSPFFRPVKGQMIPPQLASGLHIEIVFEDYRTALFQKAATVSGYVVSDIQMMLDCVALTDDTQKTLNMESASTGLEYVYPRIYTSVTSHPSAQSNVSIQVRKAVSQACLAYTVVLPQAAVNDVTLDSLNSVPWDTVNWNYRLGSLYFPHQQISDDAKDGKESYLHAQMTFDKVQHPFSESSVSVTEFKTTDGIHAASFEKDTSLNISGLPINNSRVLEIQSTFDTFTGAREIVTFLEYTCVSKSYIDNTAVAL